MHGNKYCFRLFLKARVVFDASLEETICLDIKYSVPKLETMAKRLVAKNAAEREVQFY